VLIVVFLTELLPKTVDIPFKFNISLWPARIIANASSFPYTGSATITGSLTVIGSLTYNTFKPTTVTTASTATLTPNVDNSDIFTIISQSAALSIANPTGSVVNGQKMIIRIKDNGTARAITWAGSQYRTSTDLSLPTTTVVNKTLYTGFIYNSDDTKWDLIALLNNF
jgi:hypothetical protein